jgi:hypothetical protein
MSAEPVEPKAKPARKAAKKKAPAAKKAHKTAMPVDFVARLAEGDTYTKIAADLGVTQWAVGKWAAKPEVQQALAELQREASAAALRRLTALQPKAVSAVSDVLVAPKACKVCGRGPGRKSSDKDRLTAEQLAARVERVSRSGKVLDFRRQPEDSHAAARARQQKELKREGWR